MRLCRVAGAVAVGSLVLFGGIAGCTRKPSQEEVSKLDEAKSAAESAERKLAELRQERMNLEQELARKQGELKESEAQRSALKK